MTKLTGLLLILFSCHAIAQDALVKFPTGPTTWTVTCTEKARGNKSSANPSSDGSTAPTEAPAPSAEAPANPSTFIKVFPKKIEVAQIDSVSRSVIQYSNGRKQELWSVPKLGVILTEDPSGQPFVTSAATVHGDPFSPSNFDWVKDGTRDGDKPVKFGGVECNHYKGFILVPDLMGMGKPETIACEAWIDAKSLQPVALLKGDLLGNFSFGAPPENLEIPAKFRERLNYYKISMGLAQ